MTRAPSLSLTIVPSRSVPGELSVAIPGQSPGGFRRGLTAAGFLPGDHVVLRLAGDLRDTIARSFVEQLRDPAATADPVAFVERWRSVVAEMES
jgi:hypothetical protein